MAASNVVTNDKSINQRLATLVERIGIFNLPNSRETGVGNAKRITIPRITRQNVSIKLERDLEDLKGNLRENKNEIMPIKANPKTAIPEYAVDSRKSNFPEKLPVAGLPKKFGEINCGICDQDNKVFP